MNARTSRVPSRPPSRLPITRDARAYRDDSAVLVANAADECKGLHLPQLLLSRSIVHLELHPIRIERESRAITSRFYQVSSARPIRGRQLGPRDN